MERIKYLFSLVIPAIKDGSFFKKLWLFIKEYILSKPGRGLIALYRICLQKTIKVQDNKILFTTFQQDYTCNPKYITEELLSRNIDNLEIVWAVNENRLKDLSVFPKGVKAIKRGSTEFYKEWFSSKVQVVNSVDAYERYMPTPRSNQKLFQTWHGSLGIKRFGKDPGWGLAKAAKRMTKHTDFVISNSTFEDDVYEDTLWNKNQIITLGHARNDILIDTPENHETRMNLERKVKESLNLSMDTKLFLYAPTFRNDHKIEVYDFNPDDVIQSLETRFGGKWVILARLHPTVKEMASKLPLMTNKNVVDATRYPDIQDLIVASDIFMSDYSSGIYDFVLSHKPGFLFCKDIEKYNSERGFYYKLETTPFPIAKTSDELCHNILNFDSVVYEDKVNTFLKDKGCIDDGYSSKRIVDKILEYLG